MQTAYQNCRVSGKRIVVATSEAPNHCTNAALLVSAFLTLELGYPSAEACRPFTEYRTPGSGLPLPIVNYRDAGNGPATYWISIQDCCHILEKGIRQFQLLDLSRFDVEEYEFYEQMQNGDFNWIIPGFFLAHATPHDSPPPNLLRYHEEVNAGRIISLRPRNPRFQPLIELNNLLAYMKSERIAVRGMVRLNNKLYDRNRVLGTGIQHYELYFPDGSNPSAEIVKQFMMICDNHLPYNRLPFFHQHPECGPLVNLEPEERRSEQEL
jgi:cell division cycle 14